MSNLLMQMEIFYAVANAQSFSRAGEELGVSKGYVSQQITALEAHYGVKLLWRTTRQLKLTEAGEIFLQSCAKVMAERNRVRFAIEEVKTEPAGVLKLTAPPSLCASYLAAILPTFLASYPKISLVVDASAAMKDLFSDTVDLAIRITHEPPPNYVARLIATIQFVVCATPAYLKKYSVPKKPADLRSHNCLIYTADPVARDWAFTRNKQIETIQVAGNLSCSNSAVIRAALLAGKGVAKLPEYILYDEIKTGKVVVLLKEYNEMRVPIYVLYPSSNIVLPKVKVFLEFLKKRWEKDVG